MRSSRIRTIRLLSRSRTIRSSRSRTIKEEQQEEDASTFYRCQVAINRLKSSNPNLQEKEQEQEQDQEKNQPEQEKLQE